jgi:hypothetical protein
MARHSDVHQRDPNPRPDADFEGGELTPAPGNAGRMLIVAPIRVAALRPEIGSWICEVTAFEDQGASWTLPVESVAHFQFELGAARATPRSVEDLAEEVSRFATPLVIEPDRECARATIAALAQRRIEAAAWLADHVPMLGRLAEPDHAQRRPPAVTVSSFETFMREQGLLEMDHALTRTYVSNPHSGEVVKGHLIVMAEMGIAPFHGTTVRDPATFAGEWRRERRVDHVLWRTAFLHAMLVAMGIEALDLHRGVSNDAVSPWGACWSRGRSAPVAKRREPPELTEGASPYMPCLVRRAFMTYLKRAMNASSSGRSGAVCAGCIRVSPSERWR